jgi:hypothetical protein
VSADATTPAKFSMRLFGGTGAHTTFVWRHNCAAAAAQEGVDAVRRTGKDVTLADQCVAALRWTAHDGKLLELYINEYAAADEASARTYIKKITDDAVRETAPFQPRGTPKEMWGRGDNMPSYVFDAAFALGFLEKASPPAIPPDLAQLRSQTEACLNLRASLATCAAVGRMQGALAYQARGSVGEYYDSSQVQLDGPDWPQAEGTIDERFAEWSSSWSTDQYQSGSAHITGMHCDARNCRTQGRFSFFRSGVAYAIEFLADFGRQGEDKYHLDRLCYNDTTIGQRDCTD